jgi:Zn-dependent peptidase ImmA (M78 family)/DNA-binding XRE family transcriptional regulator
MNTTSRIDRQGLGENVRRLRQARSMTQQSLASQAAVSLPALRNIESGKVAPKVDTLQVIADALGTSVLELLKPVRILKDVRFRAKRKLRTRNEILSEVAGWLESFQELEGLLGRKSDDPQLHSVSNRLKEFTDPQQKAATAAVLLREEWKVGEDEPIRNISGLFDRHGLKILSLPIQNREFFGLSVGPHDGGPAVIVNTWDRITVERWIFSAAHELGHLILHQDAFNVDETEENDQQEREADTFAAYFLMPDEAFRRELHSMRGLHWVEAVLALKRIFKVSYRTVVIRLQRMGSLDVSAWPRFHAHFKQRHGYSLEGHREPFPLHATDFLTAQLQLGALVRETLEQGKLSVSRAAKMLGCGIEEVRELAREWKVKPHNWDLQE